MYDSTLHNTLKKWYLPYKDHKGEMHSDDVMNFVYQNYLELLPDHVMFRFTDKYIEFLGENL